MIAQTYTNWELIIVDDGSTDDTKESVEALNEERIRVLTIPHCGNIALLRNSGVAAGSGEWLAFLDSDDIWTKQKLETQVRCLQQQEKSWSYGGSEMMNEAGQTIPFRVGTYVPISGWITKELLANKVSAAVGSLMVTRKLFARLGGFNNAITAREDYELILRLSMEAEAVAIPDLLVRIREHEGRRTSMFNNANERSASVYKHFVNNCKDRKLSHIAQRRLAYELTDAARKNIKQKKYWKATCQLAEALIKRDTIRHVLSTFR